MFHSMATPGVDIPRGVRRTRSHSDRHSLPTLIYSAKLSSFLHILHDIASIS